MTKITNPAHSLTNLTNHLIHQSGLILQKILRRPTLWWVIIQTQKPTCTYYFGPFESRTEAAMAQTGYIEDLEEEEAENIQAQIQQLSPQKLTLD